MTWRVRTEDRVSPALEASHIRMQLRTGQMTPDASQRELSRTIALAGDERSALCTAQWLREGSEQSETQRRDWLASLGQASCPAPTLHGGSCRSATGRPSLPAPAHPASALPRGAPRHPSEWGWVGVGRQSGSPLNSTSFTTVLSAGWQKRLGTRQCSAL